MINLSRWPRLFYPQMSVIRTFCTQTTISLAQYF